eukprot:Hpha_TRINITY_DN14953_c0_g1::TRINITY_DN14953_c0_g1_i2::g.143881::m.143881
MLTPKRRVLFHALARHVANVTESNRKEDNERHHGMPGDFYCVDEPSLGIADFFYLLQPLLRAEEWVLAVILIDRIGRKGVLPPNPFTIHRLVVTAGIISMKLSRDRVKAVKIFSQHTGVPQIDLQLMERSFLGLAEWDINVTREEIETFARFLASQTVSSLFGQVRGCKCKAVSLNLVPSAIVPPQTSCAAEELCQPSRHSCTNVHP